MPDFRKKLAAVNQPSAKEAIKNVTENRDYIDFNETVEPKKVENTLPQPHTEAFDVTSNITPSKPEKKPTRRNEAANESVDVMTSIHSSGNVSLDDKNTTLKDKKITIEIAKNKPVTLIPELDRFVKIRGKQLKVSQSVYFNVLIWEEQKRVQMKEISDDEHYMALFDACYKKYRDIKERTTVGFTADNLEFIAQECANAGISFASYINYIVEKEMERETLNGKRI